MERKIGEIFEYKGEWCQCVESDGTCNGCAGEFKSYSFCYGFEECVGKIFKKLEKVGEPYINNDRTYQLYKLPMNIEKLPPHTEGINLVRFDIVEIEIKQNKEDMEEKKLNLKPFDIQKAREGKPVCTRDGRKARIICFDRKFYHDDGYNYPIVAMVNDNDNELVHAYTQDGLLIGNKESELDLMMLPEKKEGWVNVYTNIDVENSRYCSTIYASKEEALNNISKVLGHYISTGKTEWEE